jgi:hypothetical protein
MSGASGGSLEEAARAKQAVRERVWGLLEHERVTRFPGAKGRVPNFAGAPVDLPPGGGHRGYAAVVDGSGLTVACSCSHSMGGR